MESIWKIFTIDVYCTTEEQQRLKTPFDTANSGLLGGTVKTLLPQIKSILNQTTRRTIESLLYVTDIVPFVKRNLADFYMIRYCGNKKPIKGFRENLLYSISKKEFTAQAQSLLGSGVLILPSYFRGDILKEIKVDLEPHFSVEKPSGDHTILPRSKTLSYTAVDPHLIALVSYCLGRPAILATSYGTRYESVNLPDQNDTTCWWHHDAKGNQVKVYIFLTNVPEEGQRLDYVPRTHTMVHGPWNRGYMKDNFYSDNIHNNEAVKLYGAPVRCYGPAGTVVIFDTNGLHRGYRNSGPRRDFWQHTYTSGNHLFPLSGLHPEVEKVLNEEQRRAARLR